MFDNNWYLFLLIVLVLFYGPDGLDRTESLVLIAIVAALLCSECQDNADVIEDEEEFI